MRPVGDELFHADGRTAGRADSMPKVIVAFGNFANAPETRPRATFPPQISHVIYCWPGTQTGSLRWQNDD